MNKKTNNVWKKKHHEPQPNKSTTRTWEMWKCNSVIVKFRDVKKKYIHYVFPAKHPFVNPMNIPIRACRVGVKFQHQNAWFVQNGSTHHTCTWKPTRNTTHFNFLDVTFVINSTNAKHVCPTQSRTHCQWNIFLINCGFFFKGTKKMKREDKSNECALHENTTTCNSCCKSQKMKHCQYCQKSFCKLPNSQHPVVCQHCKDTIHLRCNISECHGCGKVCHQKCMRLLDSIFFCEPCYTTKITCPVCLKPSSTTVQQNTTKKIRCQKCGREACNSCFIFLPCKYLTQYLPTCAAIHSYCRECAQVRFNWLLTQYYRLSSWMKPTQCTFFHHCFLGAYHVMQMVHESCWYVCMPISFVFGS